jgi:tetratricopeptide (TPR) repeat protein
MTSLSPQTGRAHGELLHELFALERCGQFERALAELRGIWDDLTLEPSVDGLDPQLAAEIYLRCGALIGFLGHSRQIASAQERSKNLLTKARTIFLDDYRVEKLAESENYLALAYWRTGEINEAQSWIEESQSRDLPETCDARLYSHVILDLVRLSQKRFQEIFAGFALRQNLFAENADGFVAGNFYMNYGIAAKNLGEISHSLRALRRARDLFASAQNKVQVAMAENNLSQVFKSERRFGEAHAAIDEATRLFKEIGDRTREGFSLDTKASIYFEEGKYEHALAAVEQGITILSTSENYGYLTETIATKARIQLFSADFTTATLTLLQAVEIAKVRIGEDSALRLVREFETALNERDARRAAISKPLPASVDTGDLRLALPPSIAHYKDYQGFWINNSDLESYGLERGSLAIVVPEEVRRGDLVALAEVDSDLVSCGFYDSDFGIVCLEVGSSEPQLFDRSNVRILGRVVGVTNAKKNADGTMVVRALNL